MKPHLRILQVASAMPYWAGTEKYVIDLTSELRRLGHEAIIGCQMDSEIQSRARALRIPTVPLQMRSTHDWVQLPKFVGAMRRQFDVVHIHHNKDYIVPAAAARLAGVPAVVMTRHLPHRFSNRLKAHLCGELFYDVIIAVSEAVRKTLLDCGIDSSRIRVVKNGVDLTNAQKADGRRFRISLDLPAEAFLVAAAGRLEHVKGFHVLLKAVQLARRQGAPVFGVIAGEGTEQAKLHALRDELNLDEGVRFLGFRKDVLDIVSAADAAVVPSIWADPFPYSVLEAMACSKAVVASRAGGIPEMVTEASAVLVAPGDAEELTGVLVRLAHDPARCAEMGRAGFARVQGFTIAALAANVESVYLEMMDRRRPIARPKSFAQSGGSEALPPAQ